MPWRSCLAVSTILLVVATTYAPAPSRPVLASSAPHVRSPYHKPVCEAPAKSHARCSSYVVTDQQGNPLVTNPSPPAGSYGPTQFHTGYNLPCTPEAATSVLCPTSSYGGQIIAIVDAYHTPSVASDVDAYSTNYGLPACPQGSLSDPSACLTIADENGGSSLPTTVDSGWALETSLDVETAHEICQTCKILLVETNSAGYGDLSTGVNSAVALGATEVSNSYGGSEWSTESSYDSAYTHAGVAITAASGDIGNAVEYPASSSSVVAVGGTTLNLNGDNSYSGESTWTQGGSGCSADENANAWQTAVPNWSKTGCGTKRGVVDVSADADPSTGAAVYDTSAPYDSQTGWFTVGGTSLASPIIAATFALAGGIGAGGNAQQVVYTRFTSGNSHDVTTGSNGSCGTIMCNATVGYDGPTGLGSPNGLGGFGSGSVTTTSTPTPTSTSPSTTLLSDSFESDPIGSVPSGWTVAGGTWTVQQGSGTDTTHVVSQTNTSNTNVMELVAGSSVWTNYSVQAAIKAPASSNSVTITARRQDANNNYQFLLKNGNEWDLGKRVGGTWYGLGQGSFSYSAGSWYTLTLTVKGTTISGAINGTTLTAVTDSSFSSGGISLRTTTIPSYDNIVVTS